jgi:hypothetical protein
MSRSRNIKPGFFKNEILVGLSFEYRLLFIGLWTLADREGRLEDRPTRIRMELFPADAVDVNAGLQALHDSGFILRYAVGVARYIQIIAWDKHQSPHFKEQKSLIPAPGMPQALETQGKPKASGITEASPTVAALIPSSLIPDSLNEKKQEPRAQEIGEQEPTAIGALCKAMVSAGFPAIKINQSDPRLIAIAAAGVTPAEAAAVVREGGAGKGIGWIVAAINGRRRDATQAIAPKTAPAKRELHVAKPRKRDGPDQAPKAFSDLAQQLGIGSST